MRRKIRDFQDELERLRSQINGLERTVRDKDEEIEVSNERIYIEFNCNILEFKETTSTKRK